MAMPVHSNTRRGSLDLTPSIRAVPFGKSNDGAAVQLLHRRHRLQLAAIATRLSLARGTILYREDMPLTSIYIVDQGVVKAFRDLPSGKRRITAFLLPEDIFGLAENGRYVNTAQAVSAVTLYRISYDHFTEIVQRDPDLEFQFLSKVTHALRESQRHAIVTGRRDASGAAGHVSEHARDTRPSGATRRFHRRTDESDRYRQLPWALARSSKPGEPGAGAQANRCVWRASQSADYGSQALRTHRDSVLREKNRRSRIRSGRELRRNRGNDPHWRAA